jgi:cytochrome c553
MHAWTNTRAFPFLLALLTSATLTQTNGKALVAQEPQVATPTEMVDATAKLSNEQIQFFEAKIRPVLIEHCYRCHSADGQGIRGGLGVDSRDALLAGGESGPAIVPGNLEHSLLWNAISYQDYRMPPKGQLPEQVLQDFKTWIEMGAPDPRVNEGVVVHSKVTREDIEKGKSHWAFRPLQSTTEPIEPTESHTPSWAISSIDRFVAQSWEKHGLTPNPDCQPNTLARRLCFDLTGLPPTPQQLSAFSEAWKNNPQFAIEDFADSLLASDAYAERWGRHWLDVARYAETSGKESDVVFPNAWRYRDYVIDAYRTDKPYDRFIVEQIAGDLLPANNDAQWNEQLIATGFLAIGPKSLTEQNPRQFQADLIDEQIDATTRVVLGLSVGCARCHDHKFDPIPQTDYYALAGIFQSTETFYGGVRSNRNRQPSNWIQLPVPDAAPVGKPIPATELAELKKELEQRQTELVEARRLQRSGNQPNNRLLNANILEQIVAQLSDRIQSVDEKGHPVSVCMGVQDRNETRNARILVRGEIDQPAQEVPRGFIQVLGNLPVKLPANASGRLEFAKWLVSENNPLTPRVYANRVWQHLIGQALVREPDNFGASGPSPTHPELLDHLAAELIQGGWSTKTLIRKIVSSRVYRLSSDCENNQLEADPENEWIARANIKRLEAESIRDAMLAVSGLINTKRPKGSIMASYGSSTMGPNGPINIPLLATAPMARNQPGQPNTPPPFRNPNINPLELPNYFRSVYLPIARNSLVRSLDVFDFAEPSLVVGTREISHTADQSLYLLNNPFVLELSDNFARRVLQSTKDTRGRVTTAFELAWGRPPTEREMSATLSFLREAKQLLEDDPATNSNRTSRSPRDEEILFQAYSQMCQSLFGASQFRLVQ